ncbi:MAG: type II toxin-antitoxin system VapB family antitoxin [Deltaproteobacteria bacterium]|nr:type II toxin-antitoxin system VapB family antitoxin [Deltaproteobacteria bacterium]
MCTNVVIEDNLIKEGLAYTGLKTKRELVNYALKELVDRKKRKTVLALEGKLHWEGSLKEIRENRFEDIG